MQHRQTHSIRCMYRHQVKAGQRTTESLHPTNITIGVNQPINQTNNYQLLQIDPCNKIVL